jgi:hypothetical protein
LFAFQPDYKEALDFIQFQFMEASKHPNATYIHHTCATDSKNVYVVFAAVSDVILRKLLHKIGII